MFTNPEDAVSQLRPILGTDGSLVVIRVSDGAILGGELQLGRHYFNAAEPVSLLELLPPWERQSFRSHIAAAEAGWQEIKLNLFGQQYRTLVLRMEIAKAGDALLLHLKPVGLAGQAPIANLAFLERSGIRAAVLHPQEAQITWLTAQTPEKKQTLDETFPSLHSIAVAPVALQLSGLDLRAVMQTSAGTGQSFQAQNIWSESENQYFDIEVWPEMRLGFLQCVNALLIPSRRTPHQQRIFSAAGIYGAFSTNQFGRQPVLHVAPANPAEARRLDYFLHEGNPEFLEYCRRVADIGYGQMSLPPEIGQPGLVIDSSPEMRAGNGIMQGLFHLIRMPFMGEAGVAPRNEEDRADRDREVELLLKESNHRIKNSISLAASLLQIQAGEVKSDKAKAALNDSVGRMETIAQLHESIYRQLSQDKTLDVKPFLEDILDRLRRSSSSKKIVFRYEIEEHHLPTGMAGTLGMLLNEIIQNSLKHAFKEGGKGLIAVSFYRIENMYYLSAEDNGGGNPDTKSWKESDSLGSSLIEEFVSQLGGKLRLERQTGTRYLITFHVPNE